MRLVAFQIEHFQSYACKLSFDLLILQRWGTRHTCFVPLLHSTLKQIFVGLILISKYQWMPSTYVLTLKTLKPHTDNDKRIGFSTVSDVSVKYIVCKGNKDEKIMFLKIGYVIISTQ